MCIRDSILEFVVSGEGSETLGTRGHEGVNAGLVDLALVVGLQLLKDLVQALPLLVVATALEEVSTQVGHVAAHFLEEGERSRRGVAEVHGALVDVGEDHLLVKVVDTAGVVADVGGDGVILGGDEVSISGFLGLSVEHGLEDGVRNLSLWTAHDERAADVHVGVVVHQLRASVRTCRTGQTRVERYTVVLVVPRIVDDVEFVATVEQADRTCLLYTSPSPRDLSTSRMPSSA